MPRTLDAPSGDRFLLLAAIAAALAAIFLVTVLRPLQVRAFDNAIASLQTRAPAQPRATAGPAGWTRVPFVTAEGEATSIEASNGQVRVVTLMYTHCPAMCPLAVSTLQSIQSRLAPAQRANFSVIALSLDPERDSLGQLQQFRNAAQRSPEARGAGGRWIVGRSSADGVRQLASALGVNYRVLSDGTVDHESVFVLLGRNGEILARTSSSRSVDPKFFGALQAALSAD